MYYLCIIRKRDNKPIKLNDMKVRKTYSLYIEELSENQFYIMYNFLSEQVGDKMLFAFYAYQDDCSIVVEYLDKEYFEKISNFLKTL